MINLFRKNSKGMTLLEILVAISLLSFMFIFIVQAVKQSRRQAKKIKQDITWKSSLSNVLDLIRQDFQGVSYFLDIHQNLEVIVYEEEEETPQEILKRAEDQSKDSEAPQKSFPVNLSPYFIFEGKEDEVRFYSYSFSNSILDKSSAQWMEIRYQIKDCSALEGNSSSRCLIRLAGRYWDVEEEKEEEENLILLRDFDSLKFSYSDAGDLSDDIWDEEWSAKGSSWQHKNSSFFYSVTDANQQAFPKMVKIEIEKENQKQIFLFPVSYSYLSSWNPYDKAYEGFPQWLPPKKEQKAKPSSSQTHEAISR